MSHAYALCRPFDFKHHRCWHVHAAAHGDSCCPQCTWKNIIVAGCGQNYITGISSLLLLCLYVCLFLSLSHHLTLSNTSTPLFLSKRPVSPLHFHPALFITGCKRIYGQAYVHTKIETVFLHVGMLCNFCQQRQHSDLTKKSRRKCFIIRM